MHEILSRMITNVLLLGELRCELFYLYEPRTSYKVNVNPRNAITQGALGEQNTYALNNSFFVHENRSAPCSAIFCHSFLK